ncbi:MAG TPA: hypothetical protein VER79_03835 [Candidatus Limnocylindrales bacterium]|nr:hypothetical protein [Candidatus Limnocylindrales bacterium]
MTPVSRLNLTATTDRASEVLRLEWDYRNAPECPNQQRDGLPKSALDAEIAALKAGGWALESQCANPGREFLIETFTFTRSSETGL